MRHNLYIGDSSEDEEFNHEEKWEGYDIDNIPAKHFAISSYLLHKGQGLLDSVKGEYRNQKITLRGELRKKFPVLSMEEALEEEKNIRIDKQILGSYLVYKNKAGDVEGISNQITNSKNLLEIMITDFNSRIINTVFDERDKFQENLDRLFVEIKHELCSILTRKDHNQAIYDVLPIGGQNQTIEEFITEILCGDFLLKKKESEIKNLNFHDLFSANHNLQNIEYLFAKVKYKKYKEYNFQDFLSIAFDKYLKQTYLGEYSEKPVLEIYKEFQILLGDQAIDQSNLPLLRKWSGTSLEQLYAKFLRTSNQYQEDLDFATSTFHLELINYENSEINRYLITQLPTEIFTKNQTFLQSLPQFLLEHRIIRGKTKEQGIKSEYYELAYNKDLPLAPLDKTSEKLEISKNGARTDLCFLGLEKHNYEVIAKKIQNIHFVDDIVMHVENIRETVGREIKNCFIAIINGRGTTFFENKESSGFPISHDNQVFLYKIADLIFNLETERSISAFITNPMFFDLVGTGIYTIEDLPTKLPMAMKGAVHVSRYVTENCHVPRKYKFDYIKSEANILDFLEFDVKNCKLLLDWINWKVGSNYVTLDEYHHALGSIQEIVSINDDLKFIKEETKEEERKIKRKKPSIDKDDINVEQKEELSPLKEAQQRLTGYQPEIIELVKTNSKENREKIAQLSDVQYETFSKILNLEGLDTAISEMILEWYGNPQLLGVTDAMNINDNAHSGVSQVIAELSI